MTRAGEAAEGQNGSSIVILILGLEGGFGTLWHVRRRRGDTATGIRVLRGGRGAVPPVVVAS